MNQAAVYGIALLVGVALVGGAIAWLMRIQRQINAERAAQQQPTTPPAGRTLRRPSFDPAMRTQILVVLLDAGFPPAEIVRQLRGNVAWNARRVQALIKQRAAAPSMARDVGHAATRPPVRPGERSVVAYLRRVEGADGDAAAPRVVEVAG